MKRIPVFFPLFLLVMVLGSCTSTRYVSHSFKAAAPTDIPLIEPYTDVYYIENRQGAQYNDSLSFIAHEALLDCLERNADLFPYQQILYLDDREVWRDMGGDMMQFLTLCRGCSRADIETFPLPASLAQFMADNDLPYAMMLFHSGLTRSWKNFRQNVAADAALAVGSLALNLLVGGGMYYYGVTYKGTSQMTVAVAGAAEGTISFYNTVEDAFEPIDASEDFTLLTRLFRKYPSR